MRMKGVYVYGCIRVRRWRITFFLEKQRKEEKIEKSSNSLFQSVPVINQELITACV